MQRRSLLKALSGMLAQHFMLGQTVRPMTSPDPAGLTPATNNLVTSSGLTAAGGIRQRVDVLAAKTVGSSTWFLSQSRGTTSFQVASVNSGWGPLGFKLLPNGTYGAFTVTDTGNVLVYRLKAYKKGGALTPAIYSADITTTSAKADLALKCTVNPEARKVILLDDEYYGWVDTNSNFHVSSYQATQSLYTVANFTSVDAYRLSNGDVVALSRLSGVIVYVNMTSGSITPQVCQSQEVGSFLQRTATMPSDSRPLVITTSGIIGDTLAMLVAPVTQEGIGTLVLCDSHGNTVRSAKVYLRSSIAALTRSLISVNNGVGVVCTDGSVDIFTI